MSASAFDILWSDLGHSGGPGPLAVPSVGHTADERARIRDDVYANLAERGLYRAGRLDPALRQRLELLAEASTIVECEALGELSEPQPRRAVAAAARGRAVLAVQPRRTVALTTIGESELCAAVVGVLGDFRAGPGLGVSLPASAVGAVADTVPDAAVPDSRRARVFEQQAREAQSVQSRPVLAAGQLSVRVRQEGGLRRVGGLSWFLTDAGAYLGTVSEGRADEPWFSLVPADPARLVARLAAIRDEAVFGRV